MCTDHFLVKHYGFKIQGKRDFESDTKCYDVITGKQGKFFSSKHSHVIYYSKGLSLLTCFIACYHFLLKDHDLNENHAEKKYFTFSLAM